MNSCINSLNENQIDDGELLLFPNPSSSILQITSIQNLMTYQITDSRGKVCLEEHFKDPTKTCNISNSDFAEGIYHIHILCEDKIYIKKIIKFD